MCKASNHAAVSTESRRCGAPRICRGLSSDGALREVSELSLYRLEPVVIDCYVYAM